MDEHNAGFCHIRFPKLEILHLERSGLYTADIEQIGAMNPHVKMMCPFYHRRLGIDLNL
jgi:hypothetical protein